MGKAARAVVGDGRAPQSAKSPTLRFLFDSFFFRGGENFIESRQKYYYKRKPGAKKRRMSRRFFIIPFSPQFSLSGVLPFHRKQAVRFLLLQLPLRLLPAELLSAFPRRGACMS